MEQRIPVVHLSSLAVLWRWVHQCQAQDAMVLEAHQFSHGVWNCSSCCPEQNLVPPPAALHPDAKL